MTTNNIGLKRHFLISIRCWLIISLMVLWTINLIVFTINRRVEQGFRTQHMRSEYIRQQRELIRHEVNEVIRIMEYETHKHQNDAQKKITNSVREAHAIAQNIYAEHCNSKTDEEIQQIIIDALRPIRFDNGLEYHLINQYDDTSKRYALHPEIEEKNLLNLQNGVGRNVFRDLIEIVRSKGESFYGYHWTKPAIEGGRINKITFIKHFPHFNWFITGNIDLDNVERDIQQSILKYVKKHRFGPNQRGYVFVNELVNIWDEKNVARIYAAPYRPNDTGVPISDDCLDAQGKIFQKEVLTGLREHGECYVDHCQRTIGSDEKRLKTSFFKFTGNGRFIVAACLDLDDVEEKIKTIQKEMKNQFNRNFVIVCSLFVGFLSAMLLLLNWICNCLEKEFNLFEHFFKNAADSSEFIDRNILKFCELDQLAQYANQMLEERTKISKEKSNLERHLMQSQKMEAIGTLAGGIAHDFNNILSAILGYAQLAKIKSNRKERMLPYLTQITKGAQRAADLVKQILTFSRQGPNYKSPLTLSVQIKEAIKLMRASIPSNIIIKETINSNARVMADPTRIHQVIMNLCTNAYHAMRDTGGELTVILDDIEVLEKRANPKSAKRAGKYIKLTVKDTGQGIEKETQRKMFDPYFTTKKVGEGTGLGLALVQEVVNEYNGFLEVQSELGKGTTFSLYFPMAVSYLPSTGSLLAGHRQLIGTEKIMVVDDEEPIRLILKELLEKYDYQVSLFDSAAPALRTFEKSPGAFDLVISDMTMPGILGDEFAAKILEIRQDIPIILCTGNRDGVIEKKAQKIGITQYYYKPVDIFELVRSIRQIFDAKN